MPTRLDAGLCGVAGEYFVAAELSRRGYVAALTLKNTRGIDVLASNQAGHSVGIQVKASQGGGKEWILSKASESISGPGLFYIFVNLNNGKAPEYHVVPSDIVATFTATFHAEWLMGTKKDWSATQISRQDKIRL